MTRRIVTTLTTWEQAKKLQQIARHYEQAQRAYRDGLYLSASRWEELARWEQSQLRRGER